MARITFSPLIVAASGKVADTVFSKWKGRNYIRSRVDPANPNTAAQQLVRNSLKEAVAIWQNLNADLKQGYKLGAADLMISGYNDMVKRNRVPIQSELGLYGPRVDPDQEAPDLIIPADYAAATGTASGEIDVTWTDSGQGAGHFTGIICYDHDTNLFIEAVNEAALQSAATYTITGCGAGKQCLIAAFVFRTADKAMVHGKNLVATSQS